MLTENSSKTLAMATLCCRIASSGAINPKAWLECEARLTLAGVKDASALFEMTQQDLLDLAFPVTQAQRIAEIIKTAPQVAEKLSELESLGVKVITIYNPDYPQLLLRRMGQNAPSVLFCIGNEKLFNTEGVSLTGSRELDESSADFAKQIGCLCAKEGYTLISGGAQGADSLGERAVLQNGGSALLYLSHGLLEKARVSDIDSGRILLCVAHSPYASFTAYNALARNEYIYKSAVSCFVAHSRDGVGGTFGGAKKNIKEGGPPTFVFMGSDGNQTLYNLGATPLSCAPETLANLTPFA